MASMKNMVEMGHLYKGNFKRLIILERTLLESSFT
jgi:hypothetical protein